MINDMQKKILVKAIEIGVESGEDALEILKSYPNLSIAEKQEIGKEVGIEYSPTLAEALTEKIAELSSACNKAIEDGVTIQINGVDEHFSYGIASGDQSNIDSLFLMAKTSGLSQPYHCSGGGSCKLYTPEQMSAIYVAEKMNTTAQTTYFNQLKEMITDTYKSENDVDVVLGVTWGTPLSGKYLDNYNLIMAQSNLIVKAVTKNESKDAENTEVTA